MNATRIRQWFFGSLLVYAAGIGVALAGGWTPGAGATDQSGSTALVLIGLGLLILGILASLPSWIGAIARAGRAGQRVWLVLLVLAAPAALPAYVIAMPATKTDR